MPSTNANGLLGMQRLKNALRGPGVRSVIRNGGAVIGATGADFILRAIYIVIIARSISPEEYGLWSYGAASYALALGLVIFGFNLLIPERIGRNPESASDFLRMTLAVRLVALMIAAACFAAFAYLSEESGAARSILLALTPALVGRGLAIWARIAFVALERATDFLRWSIGIRALEVLLGVVWLSLGGGLPAVVMLHIIFALMEGFMGVWMLRAYLFPYQVNFSIGAALNLVRNGSVLGLGAALTQVLILSPIILLRHGGIGLAELGQFGFAQNLAMMIAGAAIGFFGAVTPVLSRVMVRADSSAGKYGRIVAFSVLVTGALIAAVGFMFGQLATDFLLGPRFDQAGALIGPFLLVAVLFTAPVGFIQSLSIRGARWPEAAATAVGVMIMAASLSVANANWGLGGAVGVLAVAWATRLAVISALSYSLPQLRLDK